MSMSMPHKRLPARPSIEHLKKQAKRLARNRTLPLAQAQHELAKSFGHRNWAELLHQVEEMSEDGRKLFSAAAHGEGDTLVRLLRKPHPDKTRYEALRAAAQGGHIPCVDQLLYTGLDVNHSYEPEGVTVLHLAATGGHRPLVERLLTVGAHPGWRNQAGDDPASAAQKTGHAEISAYLQSVGPFASAAAAMKRGDVDDLKELLQKHPEIVTQTIKGRSLLHVLADYPADMPNAGESARALVAAGIPVDIRCEPNGANSTPLYWAASSDKAVPLVEALLDLGADIEARAGNGDTPLSSALTYNLPNVAATLIKRGAKAGIVHAAAFAGLDAVKAYFQPDGSLAANAADRHLETADAPAILIEALIAAAQHGADDVVVFLLERGAAVNGRTKLTSHHGTALHDAALAGHGSTVKLLLSRGADPMLVDDRFRSSPSGWAKHNGHADVAAILDAAVKAKTAAQ